MKEGTSPQNSRTQRIIREDYEQFYVNNLNLDGKEKFLEKHKISKLSEEEEEEEKISKQSN